MFGKNRSLIGLDIGSHCIKAVELSSHGDEFAVTGYGQSGVLSEETRSQTLASLIRKCNFRTRRVVTAVSGKSVIVRYLSLIRMSEDELRKAVEFEADKYIPFDVADVVIDCQKLEENKSGIELENLDDEKMRVLLVAAKRSLVQEIVTLVEGAGLVPEIVDVNSFALGNAFELHRLLAGRGGVDPEPERVVSLIDIGAKKTNLNIVKGTTSYFTREIYLGGDDFTSAIGKRMGMRAEDAEVFKKNPGERESELEEALSQVLEDLGNEIALSFDYYENQFDSKVEEICLSGGGAKIPFLPRVFERIFERPARVWNPIENLDVRPGGFDEEELRENALQLATAVGLASRVRN